MLAGYQALTEKEKQTLRLIVRGHDAKSMARHLGLSVHTVNERLRDARRKLEVSSSREAARLVLETEGDDPQKIGDNRMGEAAGAGAAAQADGPGTGTGRAPGVAPRAGWAHRRSIRHVCHSRDPRPRGPPPIRPPILAGSAASSQASAIRHGRRGRTRARRA